MDNRIRAMKIVPLLAAFSLTLSAQPEIDNDWVRIERVTERPHEKTPLRDHLASVSVYLTDGRQRITGSDGEPREFPRGAGDAAFMNAGKRAEENLSDRALQFVRIELKKPPANARFAPSPLDPVKLDPEHHIVLLENDRVRALRTILEPHLKAPMHEHPHYVVVYITELHTTMAMSDGRVIDNVRKPGEIAWRDTLKHATENIGDHTAIEIQVELK